MTATQKDSELDTPADNSEEIKAALKKTRDEAKSALARARAEEKSRLKAEKALSETQEVLEAVQAEIEEEREARIKAEGALTEAQKDLKAAKEEIGQERQARAKAEQSRDEAEKALTEKMRTPGIEVGERDNARIGVDENGAERRVSFVVRLTVDERRQPKRTEIEHPLSGKKESFPSLDAQRMATFMKACIGPQAVSILALSESLTPTKADVVKPKTEMSATTLTVCDVQVVRAEAPGIPASFLNPDEAFAVQVRFQMNGPEASSITANETPYELRIYSCELPRGGSSLLKIYRENLVKDVLEYSPQIQVPGLPTGSHRMLTVVYLHEPVKMISHYDGPVLKVPGERSPMDPVTTEEEPVP